MADIIITVGVPREGFSLLAGHTLHIPDDGQEFTREELMELVPKADAIIACKSLCGDVIRAGKRLKIVANYGSGYNAIDIQAAAECGIPVTNTPEETAEATAEMTIGLMMAVVRRIGEMNLRMREPHAEAYFTMGYEMSHTLRGKHLAIIGMGHIGSEVRRVAEAMGMTVTGLRRRDVTGSLRDAVADVIRDADIVSLHCPLNDETRCLMDADMLSRMKQGSYLINAARGAVIDSNALADALGNGHLAGAGLDVYPDEPHIPECLKQYHNVVLTPHHSANTVETRRAMAEACSRQVLDALSGNRPKNIVNGL